MRLFDEYWNILESKTVKQQELPLSTPPHTMTMEPDDSNGDNNICWNPRWSTGATRWMGSLDLVNWTR